MLKLLNKYKKWIIIFSFVYIYIILMLLAPSGYRALTPGEIDSTKDQYQIEGVDFNNDINTIAVYSWNELTIFQKWLIEKNTKFSVSEKYDLSRKDDIKQGRISLESSNDNALITAYEYANKKDSNISIDYSLVGFTVYSTNTEKLEIGDVITTINDKPIESNNFEDYLTSLNLYDKSRNVIESKEDYNVTITRSDDKTDKIALTKDEKIQYYPKYIINSSTPKHDNTKSKLNVGGPSGGAMQTLSIYTALLKIDLKGLKIAGTGTIETNNSSSIGRIGGLVQKFYTVKSAKVDHFIVPKSQYEEIKNLNKNIKFKIHAVETFDDLITLVDNEFRGGL